jgi:hypothetical protein
MKDKYLLRWWVLLTFLAIFCLYWESRLYSYLSDFVNSIKTCSPYDPLFHLLPAINLYGIIKIGLPITFFFGLIGLLRKFYRLPYLCLMTGLWWLARWTCMISVVFAIPPDRPSRPSGFLIADWLNKVVPDKIISYDQTFMFSGHVGLPFFYALLFYSNTEPFLSKKWFKKNWLSIIFFIWSLIQAIVAILSRSHYTIDVIVAYGMSYAIYSLGRVILGPIEELGEKLKNYLKIKIF